MIGSVGEFSTHVGNAPKLESIYAIVMYDPASGAIRHMHRVITMANSPKMDPQTIEKTAISNAKKYGHNTESLKVLHVPNHEDFSSMYSVDVEKKILIKMPGKKIPDRKKI